MNETQLKNKVRHWLTKNYPDAFVWKISDKWVSGIPDFEVIIKGKVMFIELKVKGGRLSEIQKYQINKIKRAGGHVQVCWSLEEVKQFITAMMLRR